MGTVSPCPSCGHCPTCGRGGHATVPWYPTPWYPTPFTPTITWGTTTTGNTFTIGSDSSSTNA